MALVFVPNAASVYTAAACVPNSQGHFVSLGFTANAGASGSVAFWSGSAVADGSPLMTIVCASGAQTYQSPMFNPALGAIIVASIAGGSAIIWLKAAS